MVPDMELSFLGKLEKFSQAVKLMDGSTRFPINQCSTMLMDDNPIGVALDSLRQYLVGALKSSPLFVVNFCILVTLDIVQFFTLHSFSREVDSRQHLDSAEVFVKLLRPKQGGPDATQFSTYAHVKVAVLCRAEAPLPAAATDVGVCHDHLLPCRSANTTERYRASLRLYMYRAFARHS